MAQLNFNAAGVEPQKPFEALPTGWYNVQIVKSEIKPTKAGTGAYLSLKMTVIDGPHAKRVLFTNLNVSNPNPIAQEIAQQQLSAICHATGVIQVNDSQELHGKPFQCRAVQTPPENGRDAGNDIKGFKAIDGAAPAGAVAAPAPDWANAAPGAQPAAAAPVAQPQPVAAPAQPIPQQVHPVAQPAAAVAPAQPAQATPAPAPVAQPAAVAPAPATPAPVAQPAAAQPVAAGTPPWAQ